jgi:antitoxin component YwqK of YwqJK toxin-antitoxin module
MNGLKNGECKEYYSSGKLWKKYNYIDDKLDGEYIEYSYNSSPIYKYYTNGIMQEGYIAHISNFIKNKLIEFL